MFVLKVNICQFNTEIVWMLEIIVNKTRKAHAYVQREGFMAFFKTVHHIGEKLKSEYNIRFFELLTV